MRKAKFRDNISQWESGVEQMRNVECVVLDETDSSYIVEYGLGNRVLNATIPKQYIELIDTFVPKEEVEELEETVVDEPENKEPETPKKKQEKQVQKPVHKLTQQKKSYGPKNTDSWK